jgi:hypothetical protein
VADQGEADRLNAMNGGSGFAIWGPVQPGDVVYKDLNGDGVVNNYDRAAIGNPRTPESSVFRWDSPTRASTSACCGRARHSAPYS